MRFERGVNPIHAGNTAAGGSPGNPIHSIPLTLDGTDEGVGSRPHLEDGVAVPPPTLILEGMVKKSTM